MLFHQPDKYRRHPRRLTRKGRANKRKRLLKVRCEKRKAIKWLAFFFALALLLTIWIAYKNI